MLPKSRGNSGVRHGHCRLLQALFLGIGIDDIFVFKFVLATLIHIFTSSPMAVWGSVASCCAASTSSTRRAPSPSPATTSPRPGPSPFTWFRECRSKRWREESSAWPSSCSRWFSLTLTSWRWPTPPAGSSSSWSSSCRPNSHGRAKFPTLIFLILRPSFLLYYV